LMLAEVYRLKNATFARESIKKLLQGQ